MVEPLLAGHKGKAHFPQIGFQTPNFQLQIQSNSCPTISHKIRHLMASPLLPCKSLGCRHSSSRQDQLETSHMSIRRLINRTPHRCLLRGTIQLSGSKLMVGPLLLQEDILCLHKWVRFLKIPLGLVYLDNHKYPCQTLLGSTCQLS